MIFLRYGKFSYLVNLPKDIKIEIKFNENETELGAAVYMLGDNLLHSESISREDMTDAKNAMCLLRNCRIDINNICMKRKIFFSKRGKTNELWDM